MAEIWLLQDRVCRYLTHDTPRKPAKILRSSFRSVTRKAGGPGPIRTPSVALISEAFKRACIC